MFLGFQLVQQHIHVWSVRKIRAWPVPESLHSTDMPNSRRSLLLRRRSRQRPSRLDRWRTGQCSYGGDQLLVRLWTSR